MCYLPLLPCEPNTRGLACTFTERGAVCVRGDPNYRQHPDRHDAPSVHVRLHWSAALQGAWSNPCSAAPCWVKKGQTTCWVVSTRLWGRVLTLNPKAQGFEWREGGGGALCHQVIFCVNWLYDKSKEDIPGSIIVFILLHYLYYCYISTLLTRFYINFSLDWWYCSLILMCIRCVILAHIIKYIITP